jgi:NAD-dependent dihydropyrimidine dehydrogenase PreA subunit
MISLKSLLRPEREKNTTRAQGQVVPDRTRCVQCGICSFHCPIEIDVRRHAWLGNPITDSRCLTCAECVKRCPRGVLSFDHNDLFNKE